MKEQDRHYSDKGSHRLRGIHHKQVQRESRQCDRISDECPIIGDCGIIYDQTEIESKKEKAK